VLFTALIFSDRSSV